jgi:hypothetical protein
MNKIYRKYMIAACVLALLWGPLPGASIVLGGLEVVMIREIARRHGHKLSFREALKAGGTIFSAGETFSLAALELSTFVPVLGWWVAKPAVAVSVVYGMGRLADSYFSGRGRDKLEAVGKYLPSRIFSR